VQWISVDQLDKWKGKGSCNVDQRRYQSLGRERKEVQVEPLDHYRVNTRRGMGKNVVLHKNN